MPVRLVFIVDRPLRIALLLDPFRRTRPGGEHAAALARELLGRGHLVQAFGAPPGAIPSSSEIGIETTVGLDEFAPDVVVAYAAESPAAWKGARAAGRLGAPLVILEEGFPARGRKVGRLLRGLGERLWGTLVRRRADRIVALDALAELQLAGRGFDPERIVAIPPGVDLTRYRPGLTSHLPTRHGVRGRILLVCSSFREDSGIDRVVRAFAHTVGRGDGWSLVLTGEGPARPELRALADRTGVGARVHWVPPARRDLLPGLLAASTLLLAPEDPEDVGGWRVRRALAAGLPVVAEATPVYARIVESDGCGLLVEVASTEAWTEALRLATGAPERRRRWARRARELAEESYDWARVAARVEAVLLEALEGQGARGDRALTPRSPSSAPA